MSELLLLNPKKRGRRANPSRKRRSPAQIAAFRKMIAKNPHHRHRVKRRANPARKRLRNSAGTALVRTMAARMPNPHRHHRRRNPIFGRRRHRRHHNPSVRGIFGAIMPMLRTAAVGAAGSVAIDFAFGMVNGFLPTQLRKNTSTLPGAPVTSSEIGIGDALKVVFTVAVGEGLKGATRGMSETAALGSLITQLRGLLLGFMPANMVQQLGYWQPAPVMQGTNFIGPVPIRRNVVASRPGANASFPRLSGVGAYMAPSGSMKPLLSGAVPHFRAYFPHGQSSPLLSGGPGTVTRRSSIPYR